MRPRFMNRGSGARRARMTAWSPKAASMRPRFMNRGSRAERREGCGCAIAQASMRPRFMNRGSRDLRTMAKSPGKPSASMRPRFMNRGSHLGVWAAIALRRFNEAPIHESGKSLRSHERNERHDSRAASMRPRFMNRGSAGHPRATCRERHRSSAKLQ